MKTCDKRLPFAVWFRSGELWVHCVRSRWPHLWHRRALLSEDLSEGLNVEWKWNRK